MLEKMERVSTAKPTAVRRTRSKAEKRRIVEEMQREGASVRSVARAYDIPANQLFHWRKLYREGLLGTEAEAAAGSGLVAVQIIGEQQPKVKQEKQSQGDPLVYDDDKVFSWTSSSRTRRRSEMRYRALLGLSPT